MWGLNKISALMLAASTPRKNNAPYLPDSTVQIANDVRSLYNTLGERGPVFRRYYPTIKFTYVSPPGTDEQDWRDDEVLLSDADLMTGTETTPSGEPSGDPDGSSVFARVAARHGSRISCSSSPGPPR